MIPLCLVHFVRVILSLSPRFIFDVCLHIIPSPSVSWARVSHSFNFPDYSPFTLCSFTIFLIFEFPQDIIVFLPSCFPFSWSFETSQTIEFSIPFYSSFCDSLSISLPSFFLSIYLPFFLSFLKPSGILRFSLFLSHSINNSLSPMFLLSIMSTYLLGSPSWVLSKMH